MTPPAADPTDRPSSPPILDKAPKPAGLLPRHAQTWVVTALAGLMLAIIVFTGNPTPPTRSPVSPPLPVATDPNQARIQEYRNRIDEQARRLAAEQAELAAAKRALADTTTSRPRASDSDADADPASSVADSAIDQDQRQREYRSLFADNLALTLRHADLAPPQAPSTAPHSESIAAATVPAASVAVAGTSGPTPLALPPMATSPETPSPPALPTPGQAIPLPPSRGSDATRAPSSSEAATPPPPPTTTPTPGTYRLLEGTVIETVLTTRLDGAQAGPVSCLVTTPVFAHDYQHVLIPRGSRLLGSATPVAQFDDQRLAVAFHRLVLPDGRTASLDRFPGLEQVGDTGLRDEVNRHYWSIFGSSLAVGAIAGLAQVNTRAGYDASWGDAYRQGVSASVAQSSLRILDRFLNRLPTVTIREGHRVKVYLAGDLDLPPYDDRSPAVSSPAIR